MESPKLLKIPGVGLDNCISASKFVAWYNGDTEWSGASPVQLSNVKRVAIIGNGNVALDVARILLRPPTTLAGTDISPSALGELQASSIDTVDIIGRRGPAEVGKGGGLIRNVHVILMSFSIQVSFTAAELREILGLQNVDFRCKDSTICELATILKDRPASRAKARLVEIFASKFLGDQSPPQKAEFKTGPLRRCNFFFHQVPIAITGANRISSISFRPTNEASDLKEGDCPKMPQALITRDYDLLVSAIGFKPEDDLGLSLDESGAIKNHAGKVLGHDNLYVAGWAAYGAKGDLSSTMLNSFAVAEAMAAGCADKASGLGGDDKS